MNKKSNPKVKKYLSDGTEVKVGMIITGQEHIGKVRYVNHPEAPESDILLTEDPKGWSFDQERFPKIPYGKKLYHQWCNSSRKATAEERKKYYANLNKD